MARFYNKVTNLYNVGPTIEIILKPPAAVIVALKAANLPVPSKTILALIDTGATQTSVDAPIAAELNLIARDVINVLTPTGQGQQSLYDVSVEIPSLQAVINTSILGADLANQPIDALIGRDILMHMTIIYNGWDNSYQLHV